MEARVLPLELFADFRSERFRGERFVQERNPGLEDPMMDNGVLRIPRHVDYFERWPLLNKLLGQLRPAGARHDDVGQENVDGRIPLEESKGLVRVRRYQYGVALPL